MGILIVDNSPEIINRIEELIAESRYGGLIYKATSYKEATCILIIIPIKVLLLDMNLRRNESYRLLEKIKKIGLGIIVIAMTVYMNDQLKIQYKSQGVDYIIDKYYDFEKLTSLISQITSTDKN